MKGRIFTISLLTLTLAAFAASCQKEEKDIHAELREKQLSLDISTLNLDWEADTISVNIDANCPWGVEFLDLTYIEEDDNTIEVIGTAKWMSTSLVYGNGSYSMSVAVESNSALDSRTGFVKIYTGDDDIYCMVNILQAGKPAVPISGVEDFVDWLANPSESVILTADMDFNGLEVTPCELIPDGIVLNGDGYTVSNLALTGALVKENQGTVKNMVFDNTCSLEWSDNVSAANLNIAFLAASNTGTIENCTFAGNFTLNSARVTNTKNADGPFIGTIAGRNTGLVKNCKFSGVLDFLPKNCGSTAYYAFLGGVVGCTGEDGMEGITTVKNCTCEGTVNFTYSGTKNTLRNYSVGGVVGGTPGLEGGGLNCGVIEGCTTAESAVVHFEYKNGGSTAAAGPYPVEGGIVGYAEATLKRCNNYGKIELAGNKSAVWSAPRLGGVAGFVTLSCSDCHNYGTFEVSGVYQGGKDGVRNNGINSFPAWGGVFGVAGPYTADETVEFTNCTNESDIKFCQGSATQSPGGCFGGVFGIISGKAVKCKNTASLTAESPIQLIIAGGIAGKAYNGFEGCENSGAVVVDALNCSYSTSDGILAKGSTAESSLRFYLGGIAGETSDAADAITMKNCTNSGNLTFKAEANEVKSACTSLIGGILGAKKADLEVACEGCSNTGQLTNESAYVTVITSDTVAGDYN